MSTASTFKYRFASFELTIIEVLKIQSYGLEKVIIDNVTKSQNQHVPSNPSTNSVSSKIEDISPPYESHQDSHQNPVHLKIELTVPHCSSECETWSDSSRDHCNKLTCMKLFQMMVHIYSVLLIL